MPESLTIVVKEVLGTKHRYPITAVPARDLLHHPVHLQPVLIFKYYWNMKFQSKRIENIRKEAKFNNMKLNYKFVPIF